MSEATAEQTQETKTGEGERSQLRRLRGVVANNRADKTIRVVLQYQTKHPKYGKFLWRRTQLLVHDENNEAGEGDTVEIAECRPLSKTKHHRLLRIVEKAPERVTHISQASREEEEAAEAAAKAKAEGAQDQESSESESSEA